LVRVSLASPQVIRWRDAALASSLAVRLARRARVEER
jgi:hypothetical protein